MIKEERKAKGTKNSKIQQGEAADSISYRPVGHQEPQDIKKQQ